MLPSVPKKPNFNSTDKLLNGRMTPLSFVFINIDSKLAGTPVVASVIAAALTSIFSGNSIFTLIPLTVTLYSL